MVNNTITLWTGIYSRVKCSSTCSLNWGRTRRDTNTISQPNTRAFQRCRPHNQLFRTLTHFGHCAPASWAGPHLTELNMQCPAITRFISNIDWPARVCESELAAKTFRTRSSVRCAHDSKRVCVFSYERCNGLIRSVDVHWWYLCCLFHTRAYTHKQ